MQSYSCAAAQHVKCVIGRYLGVIRIHANKALIKIYKKVLYQVKLVPLQARPRNQDSILELAKPFHHLCKLFSSSRAMGHLLNLHTIEIIIPSNLTMTTEETYAR